MFKGQEHGQAVVEYIIVLAFITLVVFTGLGDVGKGVEDIFIKAEEGFGQDYEYKCTAGSGLGGDVYVYLEEVDEGYEIKRIDGDTFLGITEGMVFELGSRDNYVTKKDGLVLYVLRVGEDSCRIDMPSPA